MSFNLCKKLNEIGGGSDLNVSPSKSSKNKASVNSKPRSYMLTHDNPFSKQAKKFEIKTTSKELNDQLERIEKDIVRERSNKQMEVMIDFGEDTHEGPTDQKQETTEQIVHESKSKATKKRKISQMETDSNQSEFVKPSNKRSKLEEAADSQKEVENPKQSKKVQVSKDSGWTIKSVKPAKKGKKPADWFAVFDSSENVNDLSADPAKVPKAETTKTEQKPKKFKKKGKKQKGKQQPKSDEDDEDYKIPNCKAAEQKWEEIIDDQEPEITKESVEEQKVAEEIDDKNDQSHISLTDGRASAQKHTQNEQVDAENDTTKSNNIENNEKSSQDIKVPKEYKFRETTRNRSERLKKKGQECENCQKWYDFIGVDGKEFRHEWSRHRDDNEIMSTPPKFYNTDI